VLALNNDWPIGVNLDGLIENTENFIYFSKGDQLDISKTGQIIIFRKEHITGFSCMGECLKLKKRLPG
jgi:hypothetical protein